MPEPRLRTGLDDGPELPSARVIERACRKIDETPGPATSRTLWVVRDRTRPITDTLDDIVSGTLPPHLAYRYEHAARGERFPTEKIFRVTVSVEEVA